MYSINAIQQSEIFPELTKSKESVVIRNMKDDTRFNKLLFLLN